MKGVVFMIGDGVGEIQLGNINGAAIILGKTIGQAAHFYAVVLTEAAFMCWHFSLFAHQGKPKTPAVDKG